MKVLAEQRFAAFLCNQDKTYHQSLRRLDVLLSRKMLAGQVLVAEHNGAAKRKVPKLYLQVSVNIPGKVPENFRNDNVKIRTIICYQIHKLELLFSNRGPGITPLECALRCLGKVPRDRSQNRWSDISRYIWEYLDISGYIWEYLEKTSKF